MSALSEKSLPTLEEARLLKNRLAPIQEAKGYFFNADEERVLELLQQMLLIKAYSGHMTCPCRLASGSYENDRDIICPCEYREADVREFGCCYCRLYATREWNAGRMPHVLVPERRPPEKVF